MLRTLGRLPLRYVAESLSNLHRGRVVHERHYSFSQTGHNVLRKGAVSNAMEVQKRIVEALRLGERGEASNLLVGLSQRNDLRGADDFIHVLNYCAESPDPLFAIEAWRIMNEKEISLNSAGSVLMVKALCKGGYLEEALNMINFLGECRGTYSVLPVYNTFLGACVEMENMVYADKCLELMERHKVGKNEATYAQLLKLAVWRKNLSVAHDLWMDYIKHYSLSIMSLQLFVWSFSSLGDLKSACTILQYMVDLVIRGKVSATKSLSRNMNSSELDIPIPVNCEVLLKKLNMEENEQSVPSRYCEKFDGHDNADRYTRSGLGFGETKSVPLNDLNIQASTPDMQGLGRSFRDLIYACSKLRNGRLAEQLVQQMQKLGFQISSHECDCLIRATVPESGFIRGVEKSERGLRNGMEILKSMQHRNLKPFDRTLAILSIGCSRTLKLDLAEILLDQVSRYSHPYMFNYFLAACGYTDKLEDAVRMLAKMKHRQATPDVSTYEQLFNLFGYVNAPYEKGNMWSQAHAAKRIKAFEMDMGSYDIKHSARSMNNLLKALGAEGMVRELIQYFYVAGEICCTNIDLGTRIYNTVLNSLIENEESEMALKIFKNMKYFGFPADAATYNIMIKYCRKDLKCYRSACSLVSMMVRDGFYPQRMTYTALIHTLLEDDSIFGKLNNVIYLLDQATSEGNKMDILVYNIILRKASRKKLIDVIEFIVGRIQQEKLGPDPTTCSAVFTAYTYCGFHSTALEALQVLSLRMICDEDGSFPEKTKFENEYIYAEDEGAESRIMKHFTNFEEHLTVSLLNLRWCAMLGLPISWLPDQSPWAKRISVNYISKIRAT